MSWVNESDRVSDAEAFRLLRTLDGDARVLREALAKTGGLRFQWDRGQTLTWDGEHWYFYYDAKLRETWRQWKEQKKLDAEETP